MDADAHIERAGIVAYDMGFAAYPNGQMPEFVRAVTVFAECWQHGYEHAESESLFPDEAA